MEDVYYFAYSLHIDPKIFCRLNIAFRSRVIGFLPGYSISFNVLEDEFFLFEKRGLANIIPYPGGIVEGVLYSIDESALPKLDYESGVFSYKYYRKKVNVLTQTGKICSAVTYAAWPDATSKGLLPSGTYLKRLIAAVARNGISTHFRRWLETHPTAV